MVLQHQRQLQGMQQESPQTATYVVLVSFSLQIISHIFEGTCSMKYKHILAELLIVCFFFFSLLTLELSASWLYTYLRSRWCVLFSLSAVHFWLLWS